MQILSDNLCVYEVKLIKEETSAGARPPVKNQVNKTQPGSKIKKPSKDK